MKTLKAVSGLNAIKILQKQKAKEQYLREIKNQYNTMEKNSGLIKNKMWLIK